MAKRASKRRSPRLPGMGGASDRDSGGGAASGIPDAETGMRVGDKLGRSNVQADKEKLFPELKTRKRALKKKLRPRTQGGSAGGVPDTK